MIIGTGKELVSFAERHGAIISQHIWEALTDLDKCAPKSVVENCHSTQQRYAKIAAELEQCAVDMNSDKLIPIVSNLNEWARQLRQ